MTVNNINLYKIRCLTNMHVGDGDATYSIIDNKVQRDVITNFPTINASSLKGSLKSFLDNTNNQEKLASIFGSDKVMAKYKIFPGMLLSIPVRSNKKPFFRATCKRAITDLLNLLDKNAGKALAREIKTLFNAMQEKQPEYLAVNIKDVDEENSYRIEGKDAILKKHKHMCTEITKVFGEDLIVIEDSRFQEIINDLPVISRNKLKNGESENLWYEEVVPRETRFYFGVQAGMQKDNELEKEFNKITEDIVQIGGNATIGYGYCEIEKIVGGK